MPTPAIAFGMTDHAKVQVSKKHKTSYFEEFVRWFQLKKYQYEVTFSLYMLTSTEKLIFSMHPYPLKTPDYQKTNQDLFLDLVLFILISLLVTAAWLYLPNHVSIIYNRIWYYLHGEFAYSTAEISSKSMQRTDLLSSTAASLGTVSATTQSVVESVGATLKEL